MHDYVIVDAFTNRPFAGNPAGVVVLDGPGEPRWMQAVAAELNLSETAFLYRFDDGAWSLRWFTPVAEVDLCGHATLASAHTLWREGHDAVAAIRFQTASGELIARQRDGAIELDFPSLPADPIEPPATLAQILGGVAWRWIGQTRHADPAAANYLVELESESVVRNLAPDVAELGKLPVGGMIVTARAESPGFDFVSRYFAPALGIAEDPVTGSAHCTSGPYWAERLGKNELRACQLSRRSGELGVTVTPERVYLLGEAVTVARGTIVSP
jgi:PhzF family phenazine biosynthesis protein